MATLIVVEQGKKTSFELQPGPNLVGRHPDCAIEIVQASVSGKHASIHGENGEFFIEDTGSRNGTFVNKQQITTRTKLNHNDMVQFGEAVSKFEQPEAVRAPAPRVPPAPAPAPQPVLSAPAASATAARTVDGGMFGTISLDDDSEEDANITGQMAGQGRFGILDTNPEAKLKAVLEISNSLAGEVDLNV